MSVSVQSGIDSFELKAKGLIDGHAYSMLRALTTRNGLRLVCLRNPWGSHEWTGRFSDNSSDWTAELKEECGFTEEEDGTFWMLYDDFVKCVTKTLAKRPKQQLVLFRGAHALTSKLPLCYRSFAGISTRLESAILSSWPDLVRMKTFAATQFVTTGKLVCQQVAVQATQRSSTIHVSLLRLTLKRSISLCTNRIVGLPINMTTLRFLG